MSVNKDILNAAAEERHREREWKRVQKDLFYFATEYLGMKLLTEWHQARLELFVKNWDHRFVLWLAPRGHYKTTLVEAELIMNILQNPNKCHLLTHASAEEVAKNVESVAHHFTHNKKLRWLRPEIMPPYQDSTFFKLTPSPQFSVKREYTKQPTVRGAQAGKEITGSHIDGIIWLDDIVGEKTLQDSTGMNDLRQWYRATIANVAMFESGCRIRGRGTRWHLDDIWNDFLESEDWLSVVDACLVNEDGEPDWNGKPVLFSEEIIALKLRQMGHVTFAMQMMNDPLTEEMKAWRQEDEQECTYDQVPAGLTVILSDSAPKGVGGKDPASAKKRGGQGDYWAITAVRFVVRKNRLIRYRLKAIQSNRWTWDEGMDAILEMAAEFGTRYILIEEGPQNRGMHEERLLTRARNTGHPKPRFIQLKSFTKGKAWRHAHLSALNSSEELVFVTDLTDEGTSKMEREQCRNFPQVRFDDLMDSLSLCCDPAVIELAPKAEPYKGLNSRKPKPPPWKKRSRYVY